MLDLWLAVEGVVVGLAHDGPVDADGVAQAHDLGDAPGPEVGDAEIADLALAHEIADSGNGFLEGGRRVFQVQVVDVDDIGAEALQ